MVCQTDDKPYTKGFATLSNGRKVSKFTWQDLAQLNTRENAHVAIRGKVNPYGSRIESMIFFVVNSMSI